jgi:hypothetical protein
MFGDGGRTGVVTRFVQGFAYSHDLVFELGADRAGIVLGPARVWFERRRPLNLVAFDQ